MFAKATKNFGKPQTFSKVFPDLEQKTTLYVQLLSRTWWRETFRNTRHGTFPQDKNLKGDLQFGQDLVQLQ